MSVPVTNVVVSLLGRMFFSVMIHINKALTKKLFPFSQNRLILSFPGHISGFIDRQSNKCHIETFLNLTNYTYYDVLINGASINLLVGVDKILSRDKLLHFWCMHGKSVDHKLTIDLGLFETQKLINIFGQTSEKPASIYIDLFFEIKTGKETLHYEMLGQRLNTCIVPLPNNLIDSANQLL